jgi:hypothetical protein
MQAIDFIPQLRAIHSQSLEDAVLFPRRREAEEIAAVHLLLCL